MKYINLKDDYFHGLAGGTPFWEIDDVVKISICSLENILKNGGIYSRKKSKERGIEFNNSESEVLYNGEDYISVCIQNPNEEEFVGENVNCDSAFFRYVRFKIGIVLKKSVETECKFRKMPYRHLPGERQILDEINISQFKAIIVGLEGKNIVQNIVNKIEYLLEEYDVALPITNVNGEPLSNRQFTKEDEFER